MESSRGAAGVMTRRPQAGNQLGRGGSMHVEQQAKTVRREYKRNRKPRASAKRRPKGPPCVGAVLAAEMRSLGLSARLTALACDCAVGELEQIFQGGVLTTLMARKLAAGFGTSAAYWTRIDCRHRDWLVVGRRW